MSYSRQGAPWSEIAEQSVLGAMLVDADVIPRVQRIVGVDSFYKLGHRHLFSAVAAVAARGDVPDPGTVLAQLEADDTASAAGGLAYMDDLAESVVTTANAEAHARTVAEYAARRELLVIGQRLTQEAGQASSNPTALAGEIIATLVPVASTASRGQGFVRVADDVEALVAEITAPPPADGLVGVPTGWPAVDVMTGGFLGGELIVFAAVPGGGKTVALINVASYNAIRSPVPRPGGFVSAEMTRRALHKRILCDLAEVDTGTMRKRTFDDLQGRRLMKAVERLRAAPLWIDETPAPDVPTMFAKVRALKAEVPDLAFVCVDYLQLLSAADEDNRAEELRAIANGLKALAKELNVPIFTAAQVNDKQTEKRTDTSKRPRPDDLQGSSGIRQAADVVAILHRPLMYGEGAHDLVQLHLAKNRELPPTTITLEADLAYQRIIPARFVVPLDDDFRTHNANETAA